MIYKFSIVITKKKKMTNLEYTPLELASLTDLEDKNNIIDTPHQEKTS